MNRHCCVVEVGGTGILIEGASGSGKTSLALGLLEHAKLNGIPSAFICDDQAILRVQDGKLIAQAPEAISGKVEVRGYGITTLENQIETAVDLVVEMVADQEVDRMPDHQFTIMEGVQLPSLKVPVRHEAGARRIIMAWLSDHPERSNDCP